MGRRERRRGCWQGDKKERDHLEDLDVDGRIMDHKEVGWEGEEWIHPAQNTVKRSATINMVLNRQVAFLEYFENPVASQEGFCSVVVVIQLSLHHTASPYHAPRA
jgi:hypothetical protein